MNYLAIGMKL